MLDWSGWHDEHKFILNIRIFVLSFLSIEIRGAAAEQGLLRVDGLLRTSLCLPTILAPLSAKLFSSQASFRQETGLTSLQRLQILHLKKCPLFTIEIYGIYCEFRGLIRKLKGI